MLFAFIYACLRLVLDIADIGLRVRNPEAELLLLRHELRVLRRQVRRPTLKPADRAITRLGGLLREYSHTPAPVAA